MSLANRYRPRTFDEVIGQENNVKILRNQIKSGEVKHGYLLTGPAGTGKTTVGRILANELNEGKGGVIEIDAASNNGVENVRNIIENAKFKGMNTKYKIYIIDEVHMLSTGAFNALLKILEEPPAYVIFILCTTDPQKMPPTVLSRLQRFNFQRVANKVIAKRLEYIVECENKERVMAEGGSQDALHDFQWAEKEGIKLMEVDNAAFHYIANLANGGVRDAISLLDTCLGYSDNITIEDVEQIVGIVGYDVHLELLNCLAANDTADAIKLINQLYDKGVNLKTFIKDFTEFITEVGIYHLSNDIEMVKIPSYYEDDIAAIDFNVSTLFNGLNKLSADIKYEANYKYLVEGWMMANDWTK